MRYGYFDDAKREYVITDPKTPLPWINYLGVDEYCALISNTAGGYSFNKDPRSRRILRYRYNNVPMDRPGRYIYVRDNDSKKYWSSSWQPTNIDLDKYHYECRHGLSYTKIMSKYEGISTETLYMVPLGESLEIWRIKVKNDTKKARDLSLFTYVEFCLWDAVMDMTDFQYNLNIAITKFKNNAMYHLTRHNVHKNYFSYFWSDTKVKSYDGERNKFTGNYRGEANPQAVENGKCTNSEAIGWAPFGGLHVDVSLKAGEEKEVTFILGYNEKMGTEKKVFKKYSAKGSVDKEYQKLKDYWTEGLNKYQAQTPDPAVNSMVNIWNQYQCRTTFNWSRSASYYESGIGRGMGFRDSNQDTLGFAYQIPAKVRQRLIDLAAIQFPEGRAMHQYFPLTKKGDSEGYGDDHLWLILAVSNYIKESGDMKFLDQMIPFTDGSEGTMYDHMKRAMEYSWVAVSYHGLCKSGFADWNDSLNIKGPKGAGVSVMVSMQFVHAAWLISEIAEMIGEKHDAERYTKMGKEMKDRINKHAWDGEWYIRAYKDNGEPIGVKTAKEGKIWINSQVWAIMSGVAEGERAEICLNSVKKYLGSKYGINKMWPGYKAYRKEVGLISEVPAGIKENAGIFCHTNPWAVISEVMLGRGDQAFEYYKNIVPSASNDFADIHWTEPYVYSQIIAGKEHRDFGQAKNSWLTGACAWNFVSISAYILGVQADYNGLIVDPCIPKKWKEYTVTRMFRGAVYNITVKNPKGVNKGVTRMTVDGKVIKGNKAPIFKDKGEHEVEVILG